MRIVHIHQGKLNPDALNGVSKAGHWMATYQSRLGHDVEVWGLSKSLDLKPRSREYTMRLFPLTRSRWILSSELKAAVELLEPTTWVQLHSVFCPEFPGITGMLRRRNVLYGVTPHGGYSLGVMRKNRFPKWLYVALRERRYLCGAAWVQATGASEVADIRSMAPEVRVELIPNGQTVDFIDGCCAPRVACERPVVGYCGRLAIGQKGLDFLLHGFESYKAKGGRGQLWLIGDGSDRKAVERMAMDGGGKDVRFFGALTGASKLEIIANFDVFIHSSRWEGMPTACLEAAAVGKPLLVSRETNLAEYVERSGAGLVLDETSAAGVARALDRAQQFQDEGQLCEMGENARRLIVEEFSWEENARRFIAAVESAGHPVR
jgi:glycosyltransferase involved in cell wall biosynthesis